MISTLIVYLVMLGAPAPALADGVVFATGENEEAFDNALGKQVQAKGGQPQKGGNEKLEASLSAEKSKVVQAAKRKAASVPVLGQNGGPSSAGQQNPAAGNTGVNPGPNSGAAAQIRPK